MLRHFVSFFALSMALICSGPLTADEGSDNAQDILVAVQGLRSEIEELEGQANSERSKTEKEALFNRADELRKEASSDLNRLADSEGFLNELDEASKLTVGTLVKENFKSTQKRFSDFNKVLSRLRRSLEKASNSKEILNLEDRIDARKKTIVGALLIMSNDLSSLVSLNASGQNTLRKTFEKQLDKNARGVSSSLSVLLDRRAQVSDRAVSTDEEEAKRNRDDVRIEVRIDRASSDLKIIIGLLKQNKKDATAYQQLLIESTGTITSDVFNADVSFGLAQKWIKRGEEWLLEKLPNLIFKLLLFFIILLLSKIASTLTRRVAKRWLTKTALSGLAKGFLSTAAGRVVFAVGTLFGLSQLGLDVTALVAGFGVAGIVVGFALQDTLSNFASGLMILFYQPFDTGDLIRVAEVEGVVNKMTLVSTEILTLDNQRFVIPNNKIWQNVIQNVTAEPHRRVDFLFGVGYGDDLQKTESILNEIILAEPYILAEPASLVRMHELADSSVNFVVRVWVKTDDYWETHWKVTRAVKDRFDAEGISIPFPQTDVHLHNTAPLQPKIN